MADGISPISRQWPGRASCLDRDSSTVDERDGTSYLDMGDAYFRADWSVAVNAVWSPLYSWILGVTMHVIRPSMAWEFPAVHAVNFQSISSRSLLSNCFGMKLRSSVTHLAFFARLARLRIIAEIPDGEQFCHADSSTQVAVINAIWKSGAKAVVAERIVPGASLDGWQRIGTSRHFIFT